MIPDVESAVTAEHVELHVAIPRQAGTTHDLLVDGAAGPCERTPVRVRCPSVGAVTFSWPNLTYSLHGDRELAPGASGRAFLLASDSGPAAAQLAAWTTGEVDGAAILEIRRLLVFTGAWTPPWPDATLLAAHLGLLDHPDPRVRREALEGFHPWLAGTLFDPLPTGAPAILPPARIASLAADPDPGVRKRLVRVLRAPTAEMDPSQTGALLGQLLHDPHPGVRRAAVVALPDAAERRVFTVHQAWELALNLVGPDIPVGRAACDALSRMAGVARRAGVTLDPEPAMNRIMEAQPERAWRFAAAWGDLLPVREVWIEALLTQTLGYDSQLVARWSERDPAAVDRVLASWAPERYVERRAWAVRDRDAPGDDTLSAPDVPLPDDRPPR